MRFQYRTLTYPLITILALSSGITGCDTTAKREKQRLAEEQHRRSAETDPPTEDVLSQIRAAVQGFMEEHHPEATMSDCTFTALTPNLYLIGVTTSGNTPMQQLTAERLRDVEEGWFSNELKENGDLLWVIDYLTEEKLKVLAERHGIGREVEAIREESANHSHSWGHRSWLDNYLLWHYIYHRPSPIFHSPASGFRTEPRGYRFHDPSGAPITADDAKPYQSTSSATHGRSSVFLSGNAWRPPLVSQAGHVSGQAFMARGSGVSGKAPMGSLSRGGFGTSGRSAGTSFGG